MCDGVFQDRQHVHVRVDDEVRNVAVNKDLPAAQPLRKEGRRSFSPSLTSLDWSFSPLKTSLDWSVPQSLTSLHQELAKGHCSLW
jgi:hypothetical protein